MSRSINLNISASASLKTSAHAAPPPPAASTAATFSRQRFVVGPGRLTCSSAPSLTYFCTMSFAAFAASPSPAAAFFANAWTAL